MITRIDRVQITVNDRREAAEPWMRLLGAVVVRQDAVEGLAAERTVLRLGSTDIELLEPAGIGIAADHLSRNRGGLFTVGLATPDLGAVRARLDAQGVHSLALGDQLYVASDWLGVSGLRVVLSPDTEPEPAGLASHLYEVTHLTHDYRSAAACLARRFDLKASHFVPIRSEEYGYEGMLTLFHPERLDRIETVTPFDYSRTMGRYFSRRGPRFYMAYVESDRIATIRDRLREHAPSDWSGPRTEGTPDNLFIHPAVLGGVMLGVSRTSVAWTWSGRPDRVERVAA